MCVIGLEILELKLLVRHCKKLSGGESDLPARMDDKKMRQTREDTAPGKSIIFVKTWKAFCKF